MSVHFWSLKSYRQGLIYLESEVLRNPESSLTDFEESKVGKHSLFKASFTCFGLINKDECQSPTCWYDTINEAVPVKSVI